MTSTVAAPLRRRVTRNWHRLNNPSRIAGVDLARGLAVLGMLAAHLLWLGSLSWTEPSTWGAIVNGRSSILFATLAGVSLGLSTGGPTPPSGAKLGRARLKVVIRALVIWLLGVLLISLDVPAAIILPTYAVIFVLALPLLAQRASRLFLAAAIVVLVASPVVVWANASPWWESYEGWLTGHYIGWNYPFPLWVAFTLAGLGLARAGMWSQRVQWAALGLGTLLAVAGYSLSPGAESSEESADRPFLAAWWTADPHSSGVLEAIGSGGFAIAVIGVCLLLCSAGRLPWLTFPLRAVGSMPLTAYVLQIVGWAIASTILLGSAHEHAFRDLDPFLPMTLTTIALSVVWSLLVGQGPLEALIGRLSSLGGPAPPGAMRSIANMPLSRDCRPRSRPMIVWFGIAQIVVALLAALVCILEYFRKRGPNDYTLGATLLVGVLLIAQVVVGIAQPVTGNPAVGDPLEFWMYLIVALLIPFGAAFWALVDRRRTANLVLVVVNFAVAVMLYRMMVIWG